MSNCKETLQELVKQATKDMNALKKLYSDTVENTAVVKDMKMSGALMIGEAYLASIAYSLAVIADCMSEEKGEINEETD